MDKVLWIIIFASIIGTAIFLKLFGEFSYSGPVASAIIASAIAVGNARYNKNIEKRAAKIALSKSLLAELKQIKKLIESRTKEIESLQSKEFFIRISDDYFTVFSQNAGNIGLINEDVAKIVIEAYMETKGLFDSVRMHSDLCVELAQKKIVLQRMIMQNKSDTEGFAAFELEAQLREAGVNQYYDKVVMDIIPKVIKIIDRAITSLDDSLKR